MARRTPSNTCEPAGVRCGAHPSVHRGWESAGGGGQDLNQQYLLLVQRGRWELRLHQRNLRAPLALSLTLAPSPALALVLELTMEAHMMATPSASSWPSPAEASAVPSAMPHTEPTRRGEERSRPARNRVTMVMMGVKAW